MERYGGEDVIIFEEFRSGPRHGDMLNYLDGYPLKLPLSNVPPDGQYPGIDAESRAAFFRRIHKVLQYGQDGTVTAYDSVDAFIRRYDWVDKAAR